MSNPTISTANITNLNEITLTGTATSYNTITILRSNYVVTQGTTTVNEDGSWTWTSSALSNGSYSYYARQTINGIDYNSSSSPSIIINISNPMISTANITNLNEITLIGTATYDSSDTDNTITFFRFGQSQGTTTVDEDGSWTWTSNALSNGNYRYVAQQIINGINYSSSSSPSITIALNPMISIANITNLNEITLTGTATYDSSDTDNTITILRSGSSQGTTTVDEDGHWTWTSNALSNGSYSYTAQQTINGVDYDSSSSPSITIALNPIILTANITNFNEITLTGTATYDTSYNTITILTSDYVTEGTTTVNEDGSWTWSSSALGNGSYSYVGRQTINGADYDSSSSPSIIINISNPTISTANITNLNEITLTGTATYDSSDTNNTITILTSGSSQGTTTVNSDGRWTWTSSALSNGSYSYTAQQTINGVDYDSSSSPSITIALNPMISIANITNFNEITLTGIATYDSSDTDNTITIFKYGENQGTTTVNEDGSWTWTSSALSNGNYSYTAQQTINGVDYDSSSSPSITLNPMILTANITNLNEITLTGTATYDSSDTYNTITILASDYVTEGTTTVNSDGSWNWTSNALSNGSYSYTAQQTINGVDYDSSSSPSITINISNPMISTANITNLNEITLIGTATYDSSDTDNTITILTSDYVMEGTTTVDEDGSWTWTSSALSNGSYSYVARQTINTIDYDSSSSPSITINISNPIISTANIINLNEITLAGTATYDTSYNMITIFRNNGQNQGTTMVKSDGSWTWTSSALGNGSYSYYAQQTINGADYDSSSSPSITINISNPMISTANITNLNEIILAGTATYDTSYNTITILTSGSSQGTTTVDEDGRWTWTSSALSNGSYRYTAQQTINGVDYDSSSSPSITINISNPMISTANITNLNEIILAGTATYDSSDTNNTITILTSGSSQGTTTVDEDGHWTWTSSALSNGSYSYTVQQTINGVDYDSSSSPSIIIALNPIISTANITNLNEITLTGTATYDTSYNTITILRSGSSQGTTTVDEDGHWTWTSSALSNGSYSYTAQQTINGVDYDSSSSPSITIALNPMISTANITNLNEITLTGTATYDSSDTDNTITILTSDYVTEGTTTVNSDGSWSWTSNALSNGSYSYTAQQTINGVDYDSSSSPSITIALNPMILTANITNFNEITLTGTATYDSSDTDNTITIFRSDYGTESTTTVNEDGSWTWTSNALSNGSYRYVARQTINGVDYNSSSSPSITINISNPMISTANITNLNEITLTGTATYDSSNTYNTITIRRPDSRIDQGTTTVNEDGSWTWTSSALGNGSYSYYARQTINGADYNSSSSPSITINISNPMISTANITNLNEITLTGTATDNTITILRSDYVTEGTTTVNEDGSWTWTSSALSNGSYRYVARQTINGVDYDSSSSPSITIALNPMILTANITNLNEITLTGTATYDISTTYNTITILRSGSSQGTTTVNSDGHWTWTSSALSNGSYRYTAQQTINGVDYDSSSSPSITIALNPMILTANITNLNEITLTGTATYDSSDNTITILRSDYGIESTTTVNEDGSWTWTSSALSNGSYSYVARQTINTIDYNSSSSPSITINISNPMISTANITNLNEITLAGTATYDTSYNTITILTSGSSQGTTTVNSDGHWTWTSSALSNGSYSYTVQQTINGVEYDSSSSPSITIDISNPMISTANITNLNEITLTGTATYDISDTYNTITILRSGSSQGTTTVDEDGRWTWTSSALSNGSYRYTAQQTINGVEYDSSSSPSITINISNPMISTAIVTTTNQIYFTGMALYDSMASSHNVIQITNDNFETISGSAIVLNNNTWSYTSMFVFTTTSYIIQCRQTVNTINYDSNHFTVIVLPPPTNVMASSSDPSSATITFSSIAGAISYTATAISGSSSILAYSHGANPMITFTTLSPGTTYTITVVANGTNTISSPSTPPISITTTIPITISSSLIVNGNQIYLFGTAFPSLLTIIDSTNNMMIGTTIVNPDETWSFLTDRLPNGIYSYKARETLHGTDYTSDASTPLTIQIDYHMIFFDNTLVSMPISIVNNLSIPSTTSNAISQRTLLQNNVVHYTGSIPGFEQTIGTWETAQRLWNNVVAFSADKINVYGLAYIGGDSVEIQRAANFLVEDLQTKVAQFAIRYKKNAFRLFLQDNEYSFVRNHIVIGATSNMINAPLGISPQKIAVVMNAFQNMNKNGGLYLAESYSTIIKPEGITIEIAGGVFNMNNKNDPMFCLRLSISIL